MRLQSVGLSGRRFLIQFTEIAAEFGSVIPWLGGLDDLRFATNGAFFRSEFLRRTRQAEEAITPYQFVEDDAGQTFTGGILHFARTPERLIDARNLGESERLTTLGFSFVSCLQVRPMLRGGGIGRSMLGRALQVIIRDRGPVWGVVSNPHLLPLYQSLGAKTPSSPDNRDGLWIVAWDRTEPAAPMPLLQ